MVLNKIRDRWSEIRAFLKQLGEHPVVLALVV